jgi:Tfp pilus assembly protein PilO
MTKKQQVSDTLTKFYKTPVAKVSLELFLSIGAVIFFALFAVRPTMLTMFDLIKEIEDKRKLDQQLQQKVAALSTAQAVYLNYEDRLKVLDEAIPSSPQFVYSLKLLEKVASEQKLIITNILVNEIPDEETADISQKKIERKSIPVTITIAGDYVTIRGFIEDVLALRRTFVVDTVIFSKNEERGTDVLQATVTLGIPYIE